MPIKCKYNILLFLIVSVLTLATQPRVVLVTPAPQNPVERHFEAIERAQAAGKDPLDVWIDKLRYEYETKGYSDEAVKTFKHLDTNGRYSYGCLQFQEGTFRTYALASAVSEWERTIYDCNLQKKISRQMILSDYSNWKHWRTSVERGLGLPPI